MVTPETKEKVANDSKQQRQNTSSKLVKDLLPQYQQLNFFEAVATVVQAEAGEILTSERVAQKLYSEIEGSDLTLAKEKVAKNLWVGAKRGRWQRVPGQLGQYTLDLKQLT